MRLVPPRSGRREWMDRPDNRPADLVAALRDIRWTNRWLGGRHALLSAIEPFIDETTAPLEILDVGTGGADIPLFVVDHAARRGRRSSVIAVDLDPVTAAIAARESAGCPEVHVVCADAARLPFADRSFDIVTASMFLHHFDHGAVVELLRRFGRLARRAVIVNDLRRHLLPWAFISLTSRLTRRHPMYVHDAPLSVLRGFTAIELQRAAHEAGARRTSLRRRWPFRLLLTIRTEGQR